MTRYKYKMRYAPQEKLPDIIEVAIGRRPDEIGNTGKHEYTFTFNDTDLTPAERQTALAAVTAAGFLGLFKFSKEELPDRVDI